MAKPRVQTRVDQDKKDALKRYAEDHDKTESDVARRAIERYLWQEGYLDHQGGKVSLGMSGNLIDTVQILLLLGIFGYLLI